jgi:hypothetical protein
LRAVAVEEQLRDLLERPAGGGRVQDPDQVESVVGPGSGWPGCQRGGYGRQFAVLPADQGGFGALCRRVGERGLVALAEAGVDLQAEAGGQGG